MQMPSKTHGIVGLTVRNVKRITAVQITPDGALVTVGGENEQGKTSVLDSIAMALGGKAAFTAEPLRRGADSGDVVVDLEDGIRVTRTFTKEGGGSLRVEAVLPTGDTAQIKAPQTWLAERIGSLSFDPLAFLRSKPADQAATLRALVGLDTSEIDAERSRLFEERTGVNRQARDADGALRQVPVQEAPAEPISLADLRRDLEAAQQTNAEARRCEAASEKAEEAARTADRRVLDLDAHVQSLVEALAAARDALAQAKASSAEAQTAWAAAASEAEAFQRADEAAILDRMEAAEAINRKVQANADRARRVAALQGLEARSQELTSQILAKDAQRAALLASCRFPVEGLSINAEGVVTFDGLPISEASAAQQVRISMAVALAMNPGLRIVLIRDGSLLDSRSMALVAQMAEEANAQVWVERVGDKDPGAVIIEDGHVRGQAPAE